MAVPSSGENPDAAAVATVVKERARARSWPSNMSRAIARDNTEAAQNSECLHDAPGDQQFDSQGAGGDHASDDEDQKSAKHHWPAAKAIREWSDNELSKREGNKETTENHGELAGCDAEGTTDRGKGG